MCWWTKVWHWINIFWGFCYCLWSGWLEWKCVDLVYDDHHNGVDTKAKKFYWRGFQRRLSCPTFFYLQFCESQTNLCEKQAILKLKKTNVLEMIDNFYDFGCHLLEFYKRSANVLLHSIHKLEKDLEQNTVMYVMQTQSKKQDSVRLFLFCNFTTD